MWACCCTNDNISHDDQVKESMTHQFHEAEPVLLNQRARFSEEQDKDSMKVSEGEQCEDAIKLAEDDVQNKVEENGVANEQEDQHQQQEQQQEQQEADVVDTLAAPRELPIQESAPAVEVSGQPADNIAEESVKSFEMTLERVDGMFGLLVDYGTSCVQVTGFLEGGGGVNAYNSSAPAGKAVERNDFITMIASKTQVKDMKAALLLSEKVQLKVVRPIRRTIKLARDNTSASWGLNFEFAEASSCLHVVSLKTGKVQEYNQRVETALQVSMGDYVESVNGNSDSARAMADAMASAKELELVILKVPSAA